MTLRPGDSPLGDIAATYRAYAAHCEALKAFNDACRRWDWVAAAQAHQDAADALDAYLNAIQASHRFMEIASK